MRDAIIRHLSKQIDSLFKRRRRPKHRRRPGSGGGGDGAEMEKGERWANTCHAMRHGC